MVLSRGNLIHPDDLPSAVWKRQGVAPLKKGVQPPRLEDVERGAIEAALEKSGENITRYLVNATCHNAPTFELCVFCE